MESQNNVRFTNKIQKQNPKVNLTVCRIHRIGCPHDLSLVHHYECSNSGFDRHRAEPDIRALVLGDLLLHGRFTVEEVRK